MTNDEFVLKLRDLYAGRKQIYDLSLQRQEEERMLVAKYEVDKCNTERQAIINKYSDLSRPIQDSVYNIEQELINN